MQIFSTPRLLASYISDHRKQNKSIGLVPTMGALHEGHMELVRNSLRSNDVTICSIYVNPLQFNDKTDLVNYPRDLDRDLEKLEQIQCMAVFCPSDEVMYPSEPTLSLDFGDFEKVMEGRYRPGHFKGVALVISKLFHMVQPDRAYFGEKDWQQLMIIRRLVENLSFPVEVVGIPIVREKDGLALSSRNQRLTAQQRPVARELFQALLRVKNELENGMALEEARIKGQEYLEQFPLITLEYLEIVRSYSLDTPRQELGKESLSICLSAFLGDVRLIDNQQVFN